MKSGSFVSSFDSFTKLVRPVKGVHPPGNPHTVIPDIFGLSLSRDPGILLLSTLTSSMIFGGVYSPVRKTRTLTVYFVDGEFFQQDSVRDSENFRTWEGRFIGYDQHVKGPPYEKERRVVD